MAFRSSMSGIWGRFSQNKEQPSPQSVGPSNKEDPGNKTFKCFILTTGKTLKSHGVLMAHLKKEIPGLHEVNTEAECDIILVFCPVVSGPATDIKAALWTLNLISDTKPAVLVVLHHTHDPELYVPDSSRAVNRDNMITVDCLFHEDWGLLPCQRNGDSLATIIKYIKLQIYRKKAIEEKVEIDRAPAPSKKATLKYFLLPTGRTVNVHADVLIHLMKNIPDLQEVSTVDECDFILAFCLIVSQAGTDTEAAVRKLNGYSVDKSAVLVVLHHTFDPECVVPNSSRAVNRDNMITADCLFHEDCGLLRCQRNDGSLATIIEYIKLQIYRKKAIEEKVEIDRAPAPSKKATLKYFLLPTGRTVNVHGDVLVHLMKNIPDLQEVSTVDECDFILAFCPIVSRAGTDTEAAVRKLNGYSVDKSAVLVVLHHTFDPECVVPDSSRAVNRKKTITVDCLFHEHQGLLPCQKNDQSLTKLLNYLKPQIPQTISSTENQMETEQTLALPAKKTYKYFMHSMGNELYLGNAFMHSLEQMSDLQKVQTKNESDFILSFCPAVSQDGSEIKRALESISEKKPLVLVAIPGNFVPDDGVPQYANTNRQNALQDQYDREQSENMGKQRDRNSSKGHDKQENITKGAESMEIEQQDKEIQLEKVKAELESLSDVRQRREENDRLRIETKLKEVTLELENTTKDLEKKKKQLIVVSKLLSEGIEEVEESKNKLDVLGKKMKAKKRQIDEVIMKDMKCPEYNKRFRNSKV